MEGKNLLVKWLHQSGYILLIKSKIWNHTLISLFSSLSYLNVNAGVTCSILLSPHYFSKYPGLGWFSYVERTQYRLGSISEYKNRKGTRVERLLFHRNLIISSSFMLNKSNGKIVLSWHLIDNLSLQGMRAFKKWKQYRLLHCCSTVKENAFFVSICILKKNHSINLMDLFYIAYNGAFDICS